MVSDEGGLTAAGIDTAATNSQWNAVVGRCSYVLMFWHAARKADELGGERVFYVNVCISDFHAGFWDCDCSSGLAVRKVIIEDNFVSERDGLNGASCSTIILR